MNIEIERKFLVNKNWKNFSPNIIKSFCITQCYIFSDYKSSMRIRKIESFDMRKNVITIKKNKSELENYEFEYEINDFDCDKLMELYPDNKIVKTRYVVDFMNIIIEIDEFDFPKKLILAEIELEDKNQEINLPEWFDKEVTGQSKYFNCNMK